jgi:hypothetical protein
MDIWGFFKAVLSDWVAFMSGAASLILTLIGFVAELQKRQAKVRHWFGIAALVCFILASISVWTSEHGKAIELSSPNIHVAILQTNTATLSGGGPIAMIWASVSNTGTDSVVTDYKLSITLTNGRRMATHNLQVPNNLEFTDPALTFKIPDADKGALDEKTVEQPITRGGAKRGLLMFFLDTSVPLTAYRAAGTTFEISCRDVNGKEFKSSITLPQGDSKYGHIPGTPPESR